MPVMEGNGSPMFHWGVTDGTHGESVELLIRRCRVSQFRHATMYPIVS
jgi:hypothetical protein